MATYVPKVLICGSVEEFRKNFNKPVEIVGEIILQETDGDVKLFFDNRALTEKDILILLDGTAEYLIFVDALDFYNYRKKFPNQVQVMQLKSFVKKFRGTFFSHEMFFTLINLLNEENFSGRVLDFDAFFAMSDLHTSLRGLEVTIDCVDENLYPIMENFYGKIYRSFDECKFHHFDALILSKERTPEEFIKALMETDALAENIFVFVRKNSPLEAWLEKIENVFAGLKYFVVLNGGWCLIKKIMPPVDVGVYVVTHKDAKLSTLPEGYKFIHAGQALAKADFGYAGDNIGDNISALNPFLDEVTALYWIWRNTHHTHAGFVHYRRFFTSDTNQEIFDAEKILSAPEILKILNEYDIITKREGTTDRSQRDTIILSTGQPDLIRIVEKIIRNYLARKQPDYLDVFDDVISGIVFFSNGIFIARRNVFDAYCEWLFSFLIDATKEIRNKIKLGDKMLKERGHSYSRVVGHFAERLLTVWLIKNHLRIKTLPTMFRKYV